MTPVIYDRKWQVISFYEKKDPKQADITRIFLVVPSFILLCTIFLIACMTAILYFKKCSVKGSKPNFSILNDIIFLIYGVFWSQKTFAYKNKTEAFVLFNIVIYRLFLFAAFNSAISTDLVIEQKPIVFDSLEDVLNPLISDGKNFAARAGGPQIYKIQRGKSEVFLKLQKIIKNQP